LPFAGRSSSFSKTFDCVDPRETVEKVLRTPLRLHSIGKDAGERKRLCVEALEAAGLRPRRIF
jgi:ABC-type microcin C transport system duplicated ATPase subunit YejF